MAVNLRLGKIPSVVFTSTDKATHGWLTDDKVTMVIYGACVICTASRNNANVQFWNLYGPKPMVVLQTVAETRFARTIATVHCCPRTWLLPDRNIRKISHTQDLYYLCIGKHGDFSSSASLNGLPRPTTHCWHCVSSSIIQPTAVPCLLVAFWHYKKASFSNTLTRAHV